MLQIISYYAEGHTKREKRKVAELKHGIIKEGDDDIWSGVEMMIPPLPPSNLDFCRIIDIDYEFQVCGFLLTFFVYFLKFLSIFIYVPGWVDSQDKARIHTYAHMHIHIIHLSSKLPEEKEKCTSAKHSVSVLSHKWSEAGEKFLCFNTFFQYLSIYLYTWLLSP